METGGYGFFTKGGKLVAGYGPQQNPGPPFWTSYISVADADDISRRVEAAGGMIVMSPMEGGPMPYTEFRVAGTSVAGMMAMPPMVPAEVPPHWLVYFAVEDADATVAKAKELGGAVRMPAVDIAGTATTSPCSR